MAGKKKQAVFLLVLMIASGVAWIIRNKPQEKLGEAAGFTRYDDCTLVKQRINDGDSFQVRMPDGDLRVLRLYFVDAPESAVKRYADGNSNEKRIAHQGDYFAGLSQAATVRIGQEAKSWVTKLLTEVPPFTVHTRNEQVYQSGRIYALLSVRTGGEERWLHELLVEEGLARIYTQGTNLPDGTPSGAQLIRLHGLEKRARQARMGAWGIGK